MQLCEARTLAIKDWKWYLFVLAISCLLYERLAGRYVFEGCPNLRIWNFKSCNAVKVALGQRLNISRGGASDSQNLVYTVDMGMGRLICTLAVQSKCRKTQEGLGVTGCVGPTSGLLTFSWLLWAPRPWPLFLLGVKTPHVSLPFSLFPPM